jgi:molybdate transport system permease protein
MEPEALLLDEPFSALDPHLRWQMEGHLRQILSRYRGVTIFITHDRNEAFRLCHELLVLYGGQVAAAGSKHELFENPRRLSVARLTGCKNVAAMRPLGREKVRVDAWHCDLHVQGPLPDGVEYLGIRAHDLMLVDDPGAENTFACWLVAWIESPFEITLHLHLHRVPEATDNPHLEIDISREDWAKVSRRPQPLYIRLDPARLLVLRV